MKITTGEEKEVLKRRVTVPRFNPKTNETTVEVFLYGLVEVLWDIDKRLEILERNRHDTSI